MGRRHGRLPVAHAALRRRRGPSRPGSGLYWYVIAEAGVDVGTVWIEVLPAGSEAVLAVFLSDASLFAVASAQRRSTSPSRSSAAGMQPCPSSSGSAGRTRGPSPATGTWDSPSPAVAPSRCRGRGRALLPHDVPAVRCPEGFGRLAADEGRARRHDARDANGSKLGTQPAPALRSTKGGGHELHTARPRQPVR